MRRAFIDEIRRQGVALKERGQLLYNIAIEIELRGLCGGDPHHHYYGLESEQALIMLEYWNSKKEVKHEM